MPYAVSEVGGLAVAFNPTSQREISRALNQLDPGLFLDPEVDPVERYVYMTVKHHLGSGVPPVTVLEWRDHTGPWPLSMALVEKVKRQEGRMDGAVKAAVEANRKKIEANRRDSENAYYEIGLDGRKISGKTSAVFPRSQALRMSRDKARAKGRKV